MVQLHAIDGSSRLLHVFDSPTTVLSLVDDHETGSRADALPRQIPRRCNVTPARV